eukprot:COSAG06_NODE_6455_length_2925_cov_1.658174_2_plen_43_part_00
MVLYLSESIIYAGGVELVADAVVTTVGGGLGDGGRYRFEARY